jgi:hypothetical protein
MVTLIRRLSNALALSCAAHPPPATLPSSRVGFSASLGPTDRKPPERQRMVPVGDEPVVHAPRREMPKLSFPGNLESRDVRSEAKSRAP